MVQHVGRNMTKQILAVLLSLFITVVPALAQRPNAPMIAGATAAGVSTTIQTLSTGAVVLAVTGGGIVGQRPNSQMVAGAMSDGTANITLLTDNAGALIVDGSAAGFITGTCASTQVLFGTGAQTFSCDAGLTYVSGTDALTVAGALSAAGTTVTSLTDSGLTATRVTFAGTAGLLSDDAGLTYVAGTDALTILGATNVGGALAVTGASTFTGAITGLSTLQGTTITATTALRGPTDAIVNPGITGSGAATGNGLGFFSDGSGMNITIASTPTWFIQANLNRVGSGAVLGWSSNANPNNASADVNLSRVSANVFGLDSSIQFTSDNARTIGDATHRPSVIHGIVVALNGAPTTGIFNSSGTVFMAAFTAASGTPNSICHNAATNEVTVNAALTCTVSSKDFKTGIGPLALSGLSSLNAMNPVAFRYNDQSERVRWGFIAEELAAQDHALGDGYDAKGIARSIDQNAILAVTVKALQELNLKVERLEKRP